MKKKKAGLDRQTEQQIQQQFHNIKKKKSERKARRRKNTPYHFSNRGSWWYSCWVPHVRPRGDGPVAVIHGGGNLLFWGCWRRRWCVLRFAGQSDAFWRNGWFGTSSQKLHTSGSQAGRQAGTNQAGNKTHIEQDIESRGVNQRDLLLHAALLQILPKLSAYPVSYTHLTLPTRRWV